MEYPVWYLATVGGGTLIALIAIVHVFISHFAVGGGLYLVLAERKGLREKSPEILAFTKRHARFFLLLTVVLGAMTGVGIWFVISLVHPGATSLLIHTFVFGWATEWVFFLVEIVAIFVYYYAFGKMSPRDHQAVGWVYFAAAWLSLFLINGIIDFMLTPGAWVETGSFWAGFFNPTFWPSLFFRTSIALLLAGVYAFLTTAFMADEPPKAAMTRFSGKFALLSFLGAVPSALWYVAVLPAPVRSLLEGASPTVQSALQAGLYAAVALFILTLLLTVRKPSLHTRPAAVLVFLCAFLFMGAFEWTREAARRPYVIHGVMFSNGILERDLPVIRERGLLRSARFAKVKEVSEEALLVAGEEVFKFQCYACHTVRGRNNDIAARTERMTYPALMKYVDTMHEKRYFMPPFAGNEAERRALAAYLAAGLHGRPLPPATPEGPGSNGAKAAFEENCTQCHAEELVMERTKGWDRSRIRKALDGLNALNPAMPDFAGAPETKDLIADHIASFGVRGPSSGQGRHGGEVVFEENCAACHDLRGGENPLLPKIAGWNSGRIREAIDRLEKMRGGMPPFEGSPEEKDALAEYLAAAGKERS